MKTKNVLTIIGLITTMTFLFACASENKIVLEKFISGKTKVLVCPVHIFSNQESSFDTIISKKIVEYINGKKYAVASVTQLCPPANNEWRANEAKILTISINLFIEFVKKNNLPEDTYILYPEFLKAGQNSTVVAVHYCLLNNKGEIAMRGLLNSHLDEFKKVNPKTNNDCVDVFINGFEEKMKK
jgi:hypothetical protein